MGRRKNDDDIIQFERYSASMRTRLEDTTRRYLKLLLREKIQWLTRSQREE